MDIAQVVSTDRPDSYRPQPGSTACLHAFLVGPDVPACSPRQAVLADRQLDQTSVGLGAAARAILPVRARNDEQFLGQRSEPLVKDLQAALCLATVRTLEWRRIDQHNDSLGYLTQPLDALLEVGLQTKLEAATSTVHGEQNGIEIEEYATCDSVVVHRRHGSFGHHVASVTTSRG